MKYKILELLTKNSNEYISGEKISEILGITRSGVWKNINSLRKEGYVIESATNCGYKLRKNVCNLSGPAICANLEGTVIGKDLHFFENVTSTFDKLKEFKPSEGLTVVAKHQTNGRGRLGRDWESNDGGIYFSFLLLPPFDTANAPFITLICALGVYKAISKHIDCNIKWPNDIVSGGKKICGILTQTMLCQDEIESIAVGIGINANITKFSNTLKYASSINLICKKTVDENLLLSDVIKQIDNLYYNTDRRDILAQYKDACANLGSEVTVHYIDTRSDVHGKCTDILDNGSMNVVTDNGNTINVNSGEVSVKGIYE